MSRAISHMVCRRLLKVAKDLESKGNAHVVRPLIHQALRQGDRPLSERLPSYIEIDSKLGPLETVRTIVRAAQDLEDERASNIALDTGFEMLQLGTDLADAVEAAESMQGPGLSLEEGAAALEMAALRTEATELHSLSAPEISAQLDEIAAAVRRRMAEEPLLPDVAGGHPASVLLHYINRVLYSQGGLEQGAFQGCSPGDYYSPLNSFLGHVLLQRRGIPITLGVVYAAVAGRLGVPMSGTSFPGHFLLRVEGLEGAQEGSSEDSLEGDWSAEYGIHGPELVRLHWDDKGCCAVKVTGDEHVPAGQYTWRASGMPSTVPGGEGAGSPAQYTGEIQLAERGYVNPTSAEVQVSVVSRRLIEVQQEGQEPMQFQRVEANSPLFVDAFHGGRVFTYEQCIAVLHTGNMDDTPERYIEPVANSAIYARMARNLANCYKIEGDLKKSKRWALIGQWLDAGAAAGV